MVPLVLVAAHIGLAMVNGATVVVDFVVVVAVINVIVVVNGVALLVVTDHIIFSCGQ